MACPLSRFYRQLRASLLFTVPDTVPQNVLSESAVRLSRQDWGLRGAGAALAPRLLCAFGSQRDRWKNADSLAAFSGIAPVTKKSGKLCQVHRRFACPKYLRQILHEFADSARIYCPWSRARYRLLRDRGMKHHAEVRKLARSWIRILFRVWQTRIPVDCDRYIEQLQQRYPEIRPYLEPEKI